MVRRILAGSRFFILIAVLASFLSAVAIVLYGVLVTAKLIWDAFVRRELTGPRKVEALDLSAHGMEKLALQFIQLIDVFLLGTVLYIIALGLYELFLDPDLPVPRWLRLGDLDDLKEKLAGVIIVLLGVGFLGEAIDWDRGTDILAFGAANALVIAALGVVFLLARRHRSEHHPEQE